MRKDQGCSPSVPVVHPPLGGVEGEAFLRNSLYSMFPSLASAFFFFNAGSFGMSPKWSRSRATTLSLPPLSSTKLLKNSMQRCG